MKFDSQQMYLKKLLLTLPILFFSEISYSDDKMILGLDVFNNKAQCGMCHTLKTAESYGQIGPNLDQLKPQMGQIVSAIENGIGVMPSFQGMLSSEEIEAVSHFVFESTSK